jgi:hypothetical protein
MINSVSKPHASSLDSRFWAFRFGGAPSMEAILRIGRSVAWYWASLKTKWTSICSCPSTHSGMVIERKYLFQDAVPTSPSRDIIHRAPTGVQMIHELGVAMTLLTPLPMPGQSLLIAAEELIKIIVGLQHGVQKVEPPPPPK